MPDNQEQAREQIAKQIRNDPDGLLTQNNWNREFDHYSDYRKWIRESKEKAQSILSTPILERTCPECGGSKQVRVQVGLNDTPANFELRPCEHCSGLDFRNDYYSRWNYLRRVKNGGLSR